MTVPHFKRLVNNALGRLTKTFGEPVRFEARDGRFRPFTTNGVYDDKFTFVDPETETLVSSNEPMVGIRMSDFPKPVEQGDLLYVASERLHYKVRDVLEDGQGGAVLALHLDQERNEQTT